MCVVKFKLYGSDGELIEKFTQWYDVIPEDQDLDEICYFRLEQYLTEQDMEEGNFDFDWEVFDEDDIQDEMFWAELEGHGVDFC